MPLIPALRIKYSWRAEKELELESPGTGVTGGCEPSDVRAES